MNNVFQLHYRDSNKNWILKGVLLDCLSRDDAIRHFGGWASLNKRYGEGAWMVKKKPPVPVPDPNTVVLYVGGQQCQ